MKTRLLAISLIGAAIIAGCTPRASRSDASLVPPTADGAPLAPLQVPTYPPLGYNVNPSLSPTTLPINPANPSGGFGVPAPVYPQNAVVQNYQSQPVVPPSRYEYSPAPRFDRGDYNRGFDRGYTVGVNSTKEPDRFQDVRRDVDNNPNIIPNSPILTPNNVLELSAVGMGVAPEVTISPAQALALAKRAAIIDGYRQLGEKMYGIRLSGQDTVRDYVLQNSTTKARVESLIRNAEIKETVYKDGLCQVSMEVKLDGRVWYRLLSAR